MSKIIFPILKNLARRVLKKYHPRVVGITGSIGKTTTKGVIAGVLSKKFRVRASEKNYNNEVGVPLTILGVEAPGKSPLAWLRVLGTFGRLMLRRDPDFPEILVLEMGADKPGDLSYLMEITRPEVAVVTAIAPAHLEFFKTMENIAKEKATLVKAVPPSGLVILNGDDALVAAMGENSSARATSFGFNDQAEIKALSYECDYPENGPRGEQWGINFKIEYQGRVMPMFLPYALARHQVYGALAAVAVGNFFEMNLVDIAEALKTLKPTPGRLNLIAGVKQTLLVDDTYNSSPEACLASLEAAVSLATEGQRWAVLGDMLELGKIAEDAHALVLDKAIDLGYTQIVGVGPLFAKAIGKLAGQGISAGISAGAKLYTFAESGAAADFMRQEVAIGDLVLIKGSQGMRMERVVKNLMMQPQRADKLLVRQYGKWLE